MRSPRSPAPGAGSFTTGGSSPHRVVAVRAPLGRGRDRLLTRLVALCTDTGNDAFTLTPRGGDASQGYEAHARAPELLAPRLTDRVTEVLAACRPDVVSSTGTDVTVLLAGLVLDPGRLRSALALAAALATISAAPPTDGPYR